MLLLLPSPPVSVLKNPFPCPSQELPTTLGAGYANQRESPFSVHPTDVFEAQKFESLRSSQSVSPTGYVGKSPKEYAPSLFLGQLQPEFREPLPHSLLELVHILPELKTHYKVISKTHQIRLATTLRFDFLLKPQIKNKVKIKVAQHR